MKEQKCKPKKKQQEAPAFRIYQSKSVRMNNKDKEEMQEKIKKNLMFLRKKNERLKVEDKKQISKKNHKE